MTKRRGASLENSLGQRHGWNTDLQDAHCPSPVLRSLSAQHRKQDLISVSPGTRHVGLVTQNGLLCPEAKLHSSYPGLTEHKGQAHSREPAIGQRSRYKKHRVAVLSNRLGWILTVERVNIPESPKYASGMPNG